MKEVGYKLEAGVAWLTLNNPPLNALSHALRKAIVEALDRALADGKVRAIVIIGGERAFSSGADIKEFSGSGFYAEPFLPALVDAIEATKDAARGKAPLINPFIKGGPGLDYPLCA